MNMRKKEMSLCILRLGHLTNFLAKLSLTRGNSVSSTYVLVLW
jgi:hypothetical protein